MTTKTLKSVYAAVSLLIGIGSAAPALATSTGVEFLGAAPVATDIFTFACPAGTTFARANVADLFGIVNIPARMRVMLFKSPFGVTVEDANPPAAGGEGGLASPTANRFGGPGVYHAMFYKTAGGADNYLGNLTCHGPGFVGGVFHPFLPGSPQQNQ
jgi:hypothetical protein